MEKVQKYESIFNKQSKDFKSNYIRFNSWKATGEKFGLGDREKMTLLGEPIDTRP